LPTTRRASYSTYAHVLPYIISGLLHGQTLRERMEDSPIPVRNAIEYGIQIAHGLAAAHEKGIVHRDLKPENVFVTDVFVPCRRPRCVP